MKPLDYLLKNAKEEANRNAWRHIDATDVSYENTLTLLMNYPSSSAVFGIDVYAMQMIWNQIRTDFMLLAN